MNWLFLTRKALYLMDEAGYFLDKLPLKTLNAPGEYKLELPLKDWLKWLVADELDESHQDIVLKNVLSTLVISLDSNIPTRDPFPGIAYQWLQINREALRVREDGDALRLTDKVQLFHPTTSDHYGSYAFLQHRQLYELGLPLDWFIENPRKLKPSLVVGLEDGTPDVVVTEPEPLKLRGLEQRLSEDEYRKLQECEDWKVLLTQYHLRALLITVPNSLLSHKFEGIPYQYKPGLTRGQFLVWTAWQAGFTPRPYCLTRQESTVDRWLATTPVVLTFKPFPKLEATTLAPSFTTLEQAVRLRTFSSYNEKTQRGKLLYEVLEDLSKAENYGLQVQADPTLLFLQVNLKFILPVTFTEVMDAIALHLNAAWDWQGDTAYLTALPNPSSTSEGTPTLRIRDVLQACPTSQE
jgi:hypothetical protein